MNSLEFSKVKLNTLKLEGGLDRNGKIDEYCHTNISGEELDGNLGEVFSEENKKNAFGENFRSTNVVKVQNPDGSEREVSIPSIVNGGMGTNVSSRNLVEAMNELGFGGHLSSIGMGFYYFKDNFEGFFENNSRKEQDMIVEEEFNKIFKEELGLDDDFIERHFFICPELGEVINEKNGKVAQNQGFNGQVGKQRGLRMMD